MTHEPQWDAPIPLSQADTLAPFPTDALPEWLRTWVEAVSVSLQVAPEMAFGFAMGALSAVTGGRLWVSVNSGWTEPTCLYIGVVALPGERKSPTQKLATEPVREFERQLVAAKAREVAEARARRDLLEMDCETLRDAYKKAKGVERDARRREYEEARAALAAQPEVFSPRIIGSDVTPEALIEILAQQEGRFALLSDEDSLIGQLCGRYSGNPAIEAFLSAYSCAPIARDRCGRTPIRVERPTLTISVPIQPSLLSDAKGNVAIQGRGLLDRFMLLVPAPRVGSRKVDTPSIPEAVGAEYQAAVLSIATSTMTGERTLRISPEARDAFRAWWEGHECELKETGRLHSVRGWGAKAEGRCIRIAALLHVAEGRGHDLDRPIDAVAMRRAVTVMRTLSEHALVAADALGADPVIVNARAIARWVAEERHTSITVRDVQRAFRGRFKQAADARAAIRLLGDHHLVRKVEAEGQRNGRPSEAYEVSPRVGEVLSFLSRVPSDPAQERREADSSASSDVARNDWEPASSYLPNQPRGEGTGDNADKSLNRTSPPVSLRPGERVF